MINVELLGGARRSFPNGPPVIKGNDIALGDVLDQLASAVPDGAPKLDLGTMLVALNGADSSALRDALVHDSDTVSIIPIVHGGQGTSKKITIIGLDRSAIRDTAFIDSLRSEFPKLAIQIVRQKFVLGERHASRIASVSLVAARRKKLLSQRLETDILMRFAGTGQISEAIKTAGMTKSENAVLVIVGGSRYLAPLRARIKDHIVRMRTDGNEKFLKRRFGITALHTSAVLSPHPLEDILVERAIVLV